MPRGFPPLLDPADRHVTERFSYGVNARLAGVRGGRYHSRWPTLRDGRLESGDLTVTTDYRHLLMEILQARSPGVDAHRVFPQAGYRRRLGVMR